jgi:hypothetical protein
VESELGEAVKVVLGLETNDASDAIVTLLDFAKKASLVLAAINDAKNADGTETSKAWKDKAASAVKEAFACNVEDRVPLAHSRLEPNADGSVDLKRVKVDHGKVKDQGVKWTHDNLSKKITGAREAAKHLREANAELRSVKITIPPAESWMPVLPVLNFPRPMPVALKSAIVNPPEQK